MSAFSQATPAIPLASNPSVLLRWYLVILSLCKVCITLAVTVTTAAGFILASGGFSTTMIAPIIGVFLLACASSALNEIQERRTDALMPRTRRRPLPAGEIALSSAFLVVCVLGVAGFCLLWHVGASALALGAFSVVWYNGVYTYLKQVTPLAVVPGALIGGIPPAIGWTAAGGNLSDPRILSFCLFLFVWQLPHFWVLLMMYSDEYEAAGIPIPRRIFTRRQSLRLTAAGIGTTFLCGTLVTLRWSEAWLFPVGLVGLWMGLTAVRILRDGGSPRSLRAAFVSVNVFGLAVVVALCVGRLCRS